MSERLASKPALEVPTSRELLDTLLTAEGSVGSTYNRFHDYSPRNLAFLMMQGCPPEPVATYGKWQELGRQVQKGEKAYSILRPIQVRLEAKDEADEDKMIRRFKVVRALFAYSQTAGEELPEPQPREWSKERALGALGINLVKFNLYDGNTGGYAVGRDVAINPVAPYPLRTLLHEISHVEHGHTTGVGLQTYRTHRGQMEFEAEASAYVCLSGMGELDEETANVSRGYVQGWLRDQQPAEASLRRVLNVSTRILTAGYKPNEEVSNE